MADPNLQYVFSEVISWDFIKKTINDLHSVLSIAIGQAMSNLWTTSQTLISYLILFFFVKKYCDGGIGSLVYNLIYFLIAAILVWIFSWEVLFSIWFELLYPFSYIMTRILLRKVGIWK